MPDSIRRLLQQLREDDKGAREAALGEIVSRAKIGLSEVEVREVLSSAVPGLPAAKFAWKPYDVSLIESVRDAMRAKHVPLLVAHFETASLEGRTAILTSLANINDVAAAKAYTDLLERHGWPHHSYPALTWPYEKEGRHGDVVLPPLLDGRIRDVPDGVLLGLLLGYATKQSVPTSVVPLARQRLVHLGRGLLAKVEAAQKSGAPGWQYDVDSRRTGTPRRAR